VCELCNVRVHPYCDDEHASSPRKPHKCQK
jgi:hypothetical protein